MNKKEDLYRIVFLIQGLQLQLDRLTYKKVESIVKVIYRDFHKRLAVLYTENAFIRLSSIDSYYILDYNHVQVDISEFIKNEEAKNKTGLVWGGSKNV